MTLNSIYYWAFLSSDWGRRPWTKGDSVHCQELFLTSDLWSAISSVNLSPCSNDFSNTASRILAAYSKSCWLFLVTIRDQMAVSLTAKHTLCNRNSTGHNLSNMAAFLKLRAPRIQVCQMAPVPSHLAQSFWQDQSQPALECFPLNYRSSLHSRAWGHDGQYRNYVNVWPRDRFSMIVLWLGSRWGRTSWPGCNRISHRLACTRGRYNKIHCFQRGQWGRQCWDANSFWALQFLFFASIFRFASYLFCLLSLLQLFDRSIYVLPTWQDRIDPFQGLPWSHRSQTYYCVQLCFSNVWPIPAVTTHSWNTTAYFCSVAVQFWQDTRGKLRSDSFQLASLWWKFQSKSAWLYAARPFQYLPVICSSKFRFRWEKPSAFCTCQSWSWANIRSRKLYYLLRDLGSFQSLEVAELVWSWVRCLNHY